MATREQLDSWEDVPDGTPRRLLDAALDCFSEQGFHATTTRDIAERAGMSPAGVYIHFSSKEELLHRISRVGHEGALRALEDVDDTVEVAERMRRRVVGFASWHARNHQLARVVQYELGALTSEHYGEIRKLRQSVDRLLRREIDEGVERGIFEVDDAADVALAIVSLCIDIARWWTPARSRSPRRLGETYATLAMRMLSHPG